MRKAEATRERILDAATAEFAQYGIAGARVERIAKAAAGNKNLIYMYFGSKEQLLETVLNRNLRKVYEVVPFTPEDLPGYTGRLFDFAMEHPDLMRLMAWFGLERQGAGLAERQATFTVKLRAMSKAQKDGIIRSDFTPAFILTVITTMASAWTSVNPFGNAINPHALKHQRALRNSVMQLVREMTTR